MKFVYLIIGSITLALGFLGIFLPLLPTTPFLLITAFCYLRSSEKMYTWLTTHKYFGKYLKRYLIDKGMSKSDKIRTILLLWLTISFSIYIVSLLLVKLLLVVIASLVSIHIYGLNTIT